MENNFKIDVEILSTINDEISPLKGIEELYSSIVHVARNILDSQACSLLLFDGTSQQLFFKSTTDEKVTGILGNTVPENSGFAWEVVNNRKLILNNNVQGDSRFYDGVDNAIGFSTRNIICTPMMARNEFVGVLEIVNSVNRDKFNTYDLILTQVIAAVSASAITTRMLNEELSKRVEELTALYEVSKVVSCAGNDREFFDGVLSTLSKTLDVERASIAFYNRNNECLEIMASFGADIPAGTKIDSDSVTAHVYKTGESLYVNDVCSDLPGDVHCNSGRYKTNSFVSIPIVYNGRNIGVFNLTEKKNRRVFDDFEMRVLSTLGSQIGGIYKAYSGRMEEEKRNRLKQEISIAAEIQRKNLSRIPREFIDMTISVLYEPSRDVGGDFFDFYNIDESKCGIMVADVSGKGIPAAIFTGTVKNIIRAEHRISFIPAELLDKANPYVYEESEYGMFATVFYALIDHDKRQIGYSSAGHNEQLLFRKKTQTMEELKCPGRPLGITEDSIYQERTVNFDKGDLLLLFTDGLVEALGGESLDLKTGYTRLGSIIEETQSEAPEKILNRLRNEVRDISRSDELFDDLTVLAIIL